MDLNSFVYNHSDSSHVCMHAHIDTVVTQTRQHTSERQRPTPIHFNLSCVAILNSKYELLCCSAKRQSVWCLN